MSNHVVTPETARLLVKAGFDAPTTLVWLRPAGSEEQYKLEFWSSGIPYWSSNWDQLPAPMATEIMEWYIPRVSVCQSKPGHFIGYTGPVTMERRNSAEAVAALVLATGATNE